MHRSFIVAAWVGIAESLTAATIHQWRFAALLAFVSLCAAIAYVWTAGFGDR